GLVALEEVAKDRLERSLTMLPGGEACESDLQAERRERPGEGTLRKPDLCRRIVARDAVDAVARPGRRRRDARVHRVPRVRPMLLFGEGVVEGRQDQSCNHNVEV